ncbi:MAG: hypothetical protein KDK97_07930 [Verrucomicrobiales bacterium]|nr:hypothetical protein [Verrucomicrobiales bacterium]MCP5558839.1 hypothetical protein [Verrucomicrobiaceae bacterium]
MPPNRIKIVHSFHELVSTPFGDGINALCWKRELKGDFKEVVEKLAGRDGITTIEDEQLLNLPLSDAGKAAVEILIEDQRLLREHGLEPQLDCIDGYLRDAEPGPVPTDVYSFHADSATVETDTYLCTYFGPSSEGIDNEEVQRKVDIPEIRSALLQRYGGEDDAEFIEWLHDHCFDLHYSPLPTAQPYVFGVGNLWRVAVEYAGCPVPPCIHRAPETLPGQPPRLLLIS